MAKKKKKLSKKNGGWLKVNLIKNPLFIFSLLILILVVFITNAPFSEFKPKTSQAKSSMEVAEIASESATLFQKPAATASPSPSPIPVATTIPTQPIISGNQVRVPILMYHYIGNNPNPGKDPERDALSVTPDKFEAQMKYLSDNGYNTVSLDTMYAGLEKQITLPQKSVVLTFDDGYIDFYVNAYPILHRYNLHATEFIPTGLIDTAYYLHWDQIHEMDKSGLISFEAHTVTHAYLPLLSTPEMRSQLIDSKNKLESELGKKVNFIAYPYGASNALVWQTAKEVGYVGGIGTWSGSVETEGTLFDLPRVRVSQNWQITDFANNL